MNTYKVLGKQVFEEGQYSLVPIRYKDRYKIMRWRNEQIYHLRQSEPLTKEKQDWYFDNVIANLFDQDKPNQVLFSLLKENVCIGYGGLVHINWHDRNAEISFIMDTQMEETSFEFHWKTYLGLIEKVAFIDIQLKKIFTYAFDLRPKLYLALEEKGFVREARLKDHYFDGYFKDVIIHSKWNTHITLRNAELTDLEVTYKWASDKEVRKYSISKGDIFFKEHRNWFLGKINDPNCLYYIATIATIPVGSFRVDVQPNGVGIISYLLSSHFHGKGLGYNLLREGVLQAKTDSRIRVLLGKVFEENKVSCLLFEKLEFALESDHSDPLVYKMTVR